ncbi:MAG TPA: hypothetical protein PKW04_13530, partial [Novosphingobium sp.]|nr:hypothetical protein [Novosphingobium sp.]
MTIAVRRVIAKFNRSVKAALKQGGFATMSMLYDEGQQAIATESRRVLDARVGKDRLLALLEKTGEFDQAFWDTAVEQGWTALA